MGRDGMGGGTTVTSYGYDIQDHLTQVTDAEGNVTSYVYSDLMTRQVSPAVRHHHLRLR